MLPVQAEPSVGDGLAPQSYKIINTSTTSLFTGTDVDMTAKEGLMGLQDYGSNQTLLRPSLRDRFVQEASQNAKKLERSSSAEGGRDGSLRLSRFIKKQSMFEI